MMRQIAYSIGVFLLLMVMSCVDDRGVIPTKSRPVNPVSNSIVVLSDVIEGEHLVLAGSPGKQFIVSYYQESGGTMLSFSAVQGRFPQIMEDQEGNTWDIFGQAVSGPRRGEYLRSTKSFMGYWFAFAAMYPGTEIYGLPSGPKADPPTPGEGWLISTDHVVQATGRDAIPALEYPRFTTYEGGDGEEDSFLEAADLVIGVHIGDTYKAYPHNILDYHEIANDAIGNQSYAVIYCPLTGTGTIWDRQLPDGLGTFGVSGMLYNNNILAFDRKTESIWTQLDARAVYGPASGQSATSLRYVETTLQTWDEITGSPDVLSDDTGYERDYQTFPYGDYKSNHDLIFYPVAFEDGRLPNKERVHGVIVNGHARIYRFAHFEK